MRMAGYTRAELLVSIAIGVLFVAGAVVMFSDVSRWGHVNGLRAQFSSMARTASRRAVECIQNGKSVRLRSNGIDIAMVDRRLARIRFEDEDGHLDTVADNRLVYVPDTSASNEEVLCTHVSPMPGTAMFEMAPSGSNLVSIRFLVGGATNRTGAAFLGTGTGVQGVEVRISASPRNLQRWYE